MVAVKTLLVMVSVVRKAAARRYNTNMEAIFSECPMYNKRNKMTSTQLVYVTALMWQHVSTSKGHLQADGVIYIREMYTTINMFITGISILQIY